MEKNTGNAKQHFIKRQEGIVLEKKVWNIYIYSSRSIPSSPILSIVFKKQELNTDCSPFDRIWRHTVYSCNVS